MPNDDILYDHCRWNDTKKAMNTLKNSSNLDMLYENGSFFDFALSEDNYMLVKALIRYFEKNQLNRYKSDSEEYKSLYNKLVETLKIAIDGYDDLSSDMKQALSSYINFDDFQDNLSNSFINDTSIPVEEDDIQLSGKNDLDEVSDNYPNVD